MSNESVMPAAQLKYGVEVAQLDFLKRPEDKLSQLINIRVNCTQKENRSDALQRA